ncbi:rhodanese-related sulfurtransferase [Nonomuraea polychroma]|uniref:Rhodanese-related sulfurtransferase n=1 Tax=Nonomuraea polychroma TaxID=46176 RepID=A0A438M0Y0_9ACTN|nr:rhodanese-like domain-containing protein [Nonomuraea polychroma]RVX39183.1 rhodanese-related sulfurtransferase [Nonomuraea polychroma]
MNVITRDELKAALGTVTVVDTLGGDYYAQQHLPGAISLVESEVADRAAALLPDKDATIVTYCTNPSCSNSKAVATRLGALGYTDVRRYVEGIEDWVQAGLPVESA